MTLQIPDRAIFLTDESPFPPTDGRKVPVANYARELERRGLTVDIVITRKGEGSHGPLGKAVEAWRRLRPYGSYFTTEYVCDDDAQRIAQAGPALLFVAPARLIGLARDCKARNPALKVVLLLNDAQWSQYWEALLYGIGRYRGGARYDLLKGLLVASAALRELTAYRPADVVVLQTERELGRLPWLRSKAVVAPNAIRQPAVTWSGQDSKVFAAQVNFANRRSRKLEPFISRDWPKIRAADPTLKIELFGPGQRAPDWVSSGNGVEYVGLVDDLDSYLSDKRALLVPLEHATGISNTVLRGLAMNMPMVVTRTASLGCRDLIRPWPADPVLIAGSPAEFVRSCLGILETAHVAAPRAVGNWSENTEKILDRLSLS